VTWVFSGGKSLAALNLGFPQSVFAIRFYREVILGEIDATSRLAKISDEASSPKLILAHSAQY
jgi:hypothetical protein